MNNAREIPKVRKAIIPAAGLGTRFLPVTKAVPKEMIPIVSKPAIQYAVEEAIAAGIEEILIVTGRDKGTIEDHFDISYELENELAKRGKTDLLKRAQTISQLIDIHYIRQKAPLGLGHAVGKGKVFAADEPVAILLPDEIMDCEVPCTGQMIQAYERFGCSVIGVRAVPDQEVDRYGIIEGKPLEDNLYSVRDLVEKPDQAEAPSNLAIVGRYVVTPEVFAALDEIEPGKGGELQLTDALKIVAPVFRT